MNLLARLPVVDLLCASAILSGCASFENTKPAPPQTKPIAVKFNDAGMSGWSDLPAGTHSVPDSQVVVSGHQKGGAVGILFGVVGVLAQGAINSSLGEEATKDARAALQLNVTKRAQSIADDLIDSGQFAKTFTTQPDGANATLSVASAIAVTFVGDTEVRPYVVLKASLGEANDKGTGWTTRYIASSGQPRPLTGSGSWTENSGELLKRTVDENLQRAIRFMLADIAVPHARDDNSLTMVQGHFPYVKPKFQTVGYKLAEDEQSIVFIPKLGDVIVFTGVNLMDKGATTYRPATKDDAVFKVLD